MKRSTFNTVLRTGVVAALVVGVGFIIIGHNLLSVIGVILVILGLMGLMPVVTYALTEASP